MGLIKKEMEFPEVMGQKSFNAKNIKKEGGGGGGVGGGHLAWFLTLKFFRSATNRILQNLQR